MKQYGKKLLILMFSAVFLLANSFTGLAAVRKTETRTPITFVSINVLSNVEADTEYTESTVLVTSNSDQYTIGSYEWVGAKGNWKIGDEPKVKVEIHAKSGCYFDKISGTKKFQIAGAEYASVKTTNEKETLELTIKLKPAGGTLDEPDNAEWVGYPPGKAKWDAVTSAGAYELRLFREGQMVYSVEKVSATTFDFLPYMTQGGRYEFTVRAIPKNTEQLNYVKSSNWVESDDTKIDEDESSPFYGKASENGPAEKLTPNQMGWKLNNDGKWYYRNSDGSYPSNQWLFLNGSWYLFDSEGYMLTGWQFRNQSRYFLNENGQMQIGWLEDGKQWYLLNSDGAMCIGWVMVNGQWYYMNQDGQMQIGWVMVNGQWYYMDPVTGMMVRNTIIEGHYINADGVMVQ